MSEKAGENVEAITVDIGDLEEVVGGAAVATLAVASVSEVVLTSAVAVAPGVSVAYNPDTCPTTPTGPVSTCMCPSNSIAGRIGSVILPV